MLGFNVFGRSLMAVGLLLGCCSLAHAETEHRLIENVMACRGGGPMKVVMSQLPDSPSQIATTVEFEKATTGGSRANADIAPGQCAWVKRPLEPHEPNEMTLVAPASISQLQFSVSDRRISRFKVDPVPMSQPDLTAQLINHTLNPEMFYVQTVFDTFKRSIAIKKIGLDP